MTDADLIAAIRPLMQRFEKPRFYAGDWSGDMARRIVEAIRPVLAAREPAAVHPDDPHRYSKLLLQQPAVRDGAGAGLREKVLLRLSFLAVSCLVTLAEKESPEAGWRRAELDALRDLSESRP